MGYYFRSATCAAASFAAGVFIDIDHLIDYYVKYGLTFKLRSIYDTCARLDMKRVYVVFHSYEIVILAWLIIWAAGLPNVWKAIAIGLTQHLIFDQLTNRAGRFGYFITYRLLKGFDRNALIARRQRNKWLS